MIKQLYFEDVEVGQDIPILQKVATTRMLVQWAGATGDFNPLHYDEEFAKSLGVGGPIVHGALKRAWLINMLTDWIGDQGELKKFSCRYRGMDYPRRMETFDTPKDGETWLCKGKIIRKFIEADDHFVECEVWVENGKGEKTTYGYALVNLPSKTN